MNETIKASIEETDLWAVRQASLERCFEIAQAAGPAVPAGTPEPYSVRDGVAVISVAGYLLPGRGDSTWGIAGMADLRDALAQALEDGAVRSVLLAIDSPGGAVRGVPETADMISQARAVKPVAAWTSGMAYSAAYWLASAAGRIYASPSAGIGSIGVLNRHVSWQEAAEKAGLQITYTAAGAEKTFGVPDKNLSDAARASIQSRVDKVYAMFTSAVAQNMGLALENRASWAEGKIFLAAEALDLGLVTAVVPTLGQAVLTLNRETHMNLDELKSQFPDLVASLQSEATQAAVQRQDEKMKEASASGRDAVLALADIVCDAVTAKNLRAVVEAGMTPAQLTAARSVFSAQAEAKPAPARDAKAEILEGLKAATPSAVGGSAGSEADVRARLIDLCGNYGRN